MSKFLSATAVMAVVVMLAWTTGCGMCCGTCSSGDKAPAKSGGDDNPKPADGDGAASGDLSEYTEVLAKLSPEDRELAEQQVVCPVMGGKLGAMGVPVVVTVKDTKVLLCCEGCRGKIEAEPDKYLAKLKK